MRARPTDVRQSRELSGLVRVQLQRTGSTRRAGNVSFDMTNVALLFAVRNKATEIEITCCGADCFLKANGKVLLNFVEKFTFAQ